MYCTHLARKNQDFLECFLLTFCDSEKIRPDNAKRKSSAFPAKLSFLRSFSTCGGFLLHESVVSSLWQPDPSCQRLHLYRHLLAGGALAVRGGNDRPASIGGAQGHSLGPAVDESRALPPPPAARSGKWLAVLVHASAALRWLKRPTLRTMNTSSQPSSGCASGPAHETAAVGAAVADGTHQTVHRQSVSPSMVYSTRRPMCPHNCSTMDSSIGLPLRRTAGCAGIWGCRRPPARPARQHRWWPTSPRLVLHQVDGHRPARQLGIQVQKLLLCPVGAQKVVAAAIGQAAHGGACQSRGPR